MLSDLLIEARGQYQYLKILFKEIFEDCMKGLNEEQQTNSSYNVNHYKNNKINEKMEFDDDDEDWTAV